MTTPAEHHETVLRQSRAVFSEIADAAYSLKNLAALLVGNGGVMEADGAAILGGMAALIGFQSIFNIFVATGLMPNTGIPLPFVSYGLTSLLSLYLGMGFVLNVGLQPKKY